MYIELNEKQQMNEKQQRKLSTYESSNKDTVDSRSIQVNLRPVLTSYIVLAIKESPLLRTVTPDPEFESWRRP